MTDQNNNHKLDHSFSCQYEKNVICLFMINTTNSLNDFWKATKTMNITWKWMKKIIIQNVQKSFLNIIFKISIFKCTINETLCFKKNEYQKMKNCVWNWYQQCMIFHLLNILKKKYFDSICTKFFLIKYETKCLKNLYKIVILVNEISFDMIENKIYFVHCSYLIKFDKNCSWILLWIYWKTMIIQIS